MPKVEFGERLTELRERSGLSQKEVADKAGIAEAYLDDIEKGKRVKVMPGDKVIQRFATILNADEHDLMTLSKDIPSYDRLRSRLGKPLAFLFGGTGILISVFFLVFALLSLFKATPRDSDGFYSTWTIHPAAASSALLMKPGDIEINAGTMGELSTFKIRVSSQNPSDWIFIGTGNQTYIDSYLHDSAYNQVTSLRVFPYFDVSTKEQNQPAQGMPGDPALQPFWVSTSYGTGTQELVWNIEPSRDSLVVVGANGLSALDVIIAPNVPLSKISGFGYLVIVLILMPLSLVIVSFAARQRSFAGFPS